MARGDAGIPGGEVMDGRGDWNREAATVGWEEGIGGAPSAIIGLTPVKKPVWSRPSFSLSESSSSSSRRKDPEGFSGLDCRTCSGEAGGFNPTWCMASMMNQHCRLQELE